MWNAKDNVIAQLVSRKSKDLHKELRQCLLDEAAKTFEEYSRKTPISRIKENLIYEDIYNLGFCLAQKCVTEELESVYRPEKEQIEPELSETSPLADVFATMATMSKEYDDNKTEMTKQFNELKSQFSELKSQFDELISRVNKCPNACSTETRLAEPPVSQEGTQEEENEPEPDLATNLLPNGLLESPEDLTPPRSDPLLQATPTPPTTAAPNTRPITAAPNTTNTRPITAAPKVTDIFIGGINPENSSADVQMHINSKTNLCIQLKDIK